MILGKLAVLCAAIFLASCQLTPPRATPCSIVNTDVAECNLTTRPDYVFDKPIREMLGYTCFSPDDLREIRKYFRKVILELELQSAKTPIISSGSQAVARGH